jgi:hypothetical protein
MRSANLLLLGLLVSFATYWVVTVFAGWVAQSLMWLGIMR